VPARRLPLLVVTGASGSGKTTLLPLVGARLAGECAVFDVDLLIDPLQPGDDWTAFRDAWLHVAHGVAQNGLPTLLVAPFTPSQVDELAGRALVGDVHFFLLDCADDERRRRLEARPRWRLRDVDAQTSFGRWLRAHVPDALDTSVCSVDEAAAAVADWARARLSPR
jgi:hypothetical protein